MPEAKKVEIALQLEPKTVELLKAVARRNVRTRAQVAERRRQGRA
jgi:hypothetical protein